MRLQEARLPPGLRIYAVGDIHGRSDLLDRLHAMIEADMQTAPDRRLIIYLGDYVDRGPDSAAVVERLCRYRPRNVESIALLGNHEAMMLDFLDAPNAAPLWLANGGDATLRSYDVRVPQPGEGFHMAHRALQGVLPPHHLRFLQDLAVQVRFGDYLFVHAGIKPGLPLDHQSREQMIWIRDVFLDSGADHGFIVVHGHTVAREVEWRPNRIGIDTGAYATGHLTALVLEGGERRLLQT